MHCGVAYCATAQMHTGKMVVKNVRVEKCGQRGVVGKYCLHFHRLSDCPNCEFSGNAIEHSHHRGIIVHGSHRTTVENNVLWDVRGAGIYVEDGNEMANQIKYNVVICPWPLADGVLRGCTVPGTDNAEADTPLNQAGIYTDTAANDFIGIEYRIRLMGCCYKLRVVGRVRHMDKYVLPTFPLVDGRAIPSTAIHDLVSTPSVEAIHVIPINQSLRMGLIPIRRTLARDIRMRGTIVAGRLVY